MNYQINKENYHRFDILAVNKLPARSYFIPFASKEHADRVSILEKRYHSTKVRCLSGQWDFRFYPQPADMPSVLDTETMVFDTIDVPACWQFRGYDRPFYVNSRYQFPFHPPEIPQDEPMGTVFSWIGNDTGLKLRWDKPENQFNYVGVYRKRFDVENLQKRRILSFLGVASCLDLYVNGRFVGYSEGSHNTAEFDITDFVHAEENELLAVVRRWCTGSYLECQDMFRNNGIFRDVLLYELDRTDLWDVSVNTNKEDTGYCADISLKTLADTTVTITLDGHGLLQREQLDTKNCEGRLCLKNLDVQQWSAEKPVLYELYLETGSGCVKLRIGFKEVRIQGNIFLLNGQKVKLRGVNHHDTSCRNGYTLTPAEMEQDVLLCKRFNIDTVRTSHYPPDPMFLELCDKYGIYVVNEADLETHGTVAQQLPPSFNTLSHDSRWENRYLERVNRLYHRDKNHTCIVMWSLGNESGGYRNTDAMYAWLKQQTAIPIHYESVIHTKRVAYDVGSEMYPSVKKVAQVGKCQRKQKQLNDRPYFLCEYAHAMGVGPGGVEEYWQEIYAHDNLMGGCVWEMIDHAVLHEDGSYTYGGDHGEWEHDGNFCVDGLFYPDRTPSTGAKVIAHVYRPLRFAYLGENKYRVFNTMSFTNGSDYEVTFRFGDGNIQTPYLSVKPMEKQIVEVPGGGDNVIITVSRNGQVVSREQILFSVTAAVAEPVCQPLPKGLSVTDGVVTIEKDGKKLVSARPYTLLFRAPTDNDNGAFSAGIFREYTAQKETHLSTTISDSAIQVNWEIRCPKHTFLCQDTYESCQDGILVTSRLRCTRGKGKLPRFAKAFRLDSSFWQVEYLGRNGESYCDMKEHTQLERVACQVADMVEPNIRPQESGNRCDTLWVKVSDGETEFSFTATQVPFELGIKPYSDQELLTMTHREDEVITGSYIALSAFQMGIGSGSCGPTALPQYCFDCRKEYTLKFLIH